MFIANKVAAFTSTLTFSIIIMPFFKKSLAGPGYITLNILQVMNIIGLLAVIAADTVMLVKTFIISKFFFFDAVSHVITASIAGGSSLTQTNTLLDLTICIAFLIVSELNLFQTYFARNWPLLSRSSGFVALGTAMIVLGVSLLGNLNKQATSQESLGLPFWRIVISSGILILILGVLNIISVSPFLSPQYSANLPLTISTELHIPRHKIRRNSPRDPLLRRRSRPKAHHHQSRNLNRQSQTLPPEPTKHTPVLSLAHRRPSFAS